MEESKIGIKWQAVKAEMDSQQWEVDTCDDVDWRSVFLGTVFDLYPSGKFYTPWANSNVDVCESCAEANDGPCEEDSPCYSNKWTDPLDPANADKHCEVCRDIAFTKQLEHEAEEHGYVVASGEGDPCDIFIIEVRDITENEDV